jgi:translation initiation factor 2D
LIYGPPFPAAAKKGAVVAVAGHDRLSVPMVVGRCVIDVAELKETRGVKGVAVETVHWEGDWVHVWGGPTKEVAGVIEGWANKDLAAQVEALDLEDEEEEDGPSGGVPLSANSESNTNGKFDDLRQAEPEPEREYTTAEVDEIFFNAFLYGLAHHKSLHPATKSHGIDFPITQTKLMSELINPFLPTFTAHDTQQLTIKKTSHKTIKKFIKSLDKRKVVKSKDTKDEAVIVEVDFEDPAVLGFRPYRLPKKEAASVNGAEVEESGSDPSIGQQLKVLQLFKPKPSFSPLFTPQDRKDFYTSTELKTAVTTYIESQNLVSPNNKRMVKLDPFLANSVFDSSDKGGSKNAGVDKEAIARGQVPRDVLSQRVLDACSPFHLILRNGTHDASAKPKSGAPPKISITLETRSGNKTATKVSGLETYNIAPQPLADELRKACAGSTSVERLQGSSPKTPVMEVMIQGPQAEAVKKALARRGVEERWIEVNDKTKGKGKGR